MSSDYLPTATLERLKQRAELIRQIRRFFDERGFLEVETPILSHDTCIDRHLHPIAVDREAIRSGLHHRGPSNSGASSSDSTDRPLWLQTSPEFGMKRLLAAGATAIYQITKVFRGGEQGTRHNPEFTMLEWYRVGDDLRAGMDLLAEFAAAILQLPIARQCSYQALFQQYLSLDPHRASLEELMEVTARQNIRLAPEAASSQDRDFWLNLLLSEVIEPQLGFTSPVIVYDWPASQSALAVVRGTDQQVAERFELYVQGLEIANGYHELLDAQELRVRNRTQNQLRAADGLCELPEESRLLAAMEAGLPGCAGVALGVDRLAMLKLGCNSIEQVIAFPFDRA